MIDGGQRKDGGSLWKKWIGWRAPPSLEITDKRRHMMTHDEAASEQGPGRWPPSFGTAECPRAFRLLILKFRLVSTWACDKTVGRRSRNPDAMRKGSVGQQHVGE